MKRKQWVVLATEEEMVAIKEEAVSYFGQAGKEVDCFGL